MRTTDVPGGAPGRHRVVLGLLLLAIPVLSVAGLQQGWSPSHVAAESVLPLLGAWSIGRFADGRRLRAGAASVGLMYASAVGVHVAGGVTEAHFFFFVAFGLVALYRDWWVFFAAAGFAVGHHVLFALGDQTVLFAEPYQLEDPLLWAAVHVLFVTVATAVAAVGMHDVGRSVRRQTEAEAAATRAEERWATALELHDDVVQALATANYAHELGQPDLQHEAIHRALVGSRRVVREMLDGADLDTHLLRRPSATPPIREGAAVGSDDTAGGEPGAARP